MTDTQELLPEVRELFHPCERAVCSGCGNFGHPHCVGRVVLADRVLICTCYCHETLNKKQEAGRLGGLARQQKLRDARTPSTPAVDSQPVPAGQDEVEKALAELGEINYTDVIIESRHSTDKGIAGNLGSVNIAIWLGSGWKDFNAPRLSDVMQKVREWKEQQ